MYSLSSINYLDKFEKCYKKIISINCIPKGPLEKYVTRLTLPKLSEADVDSACCPRESCVYVLKNVNNNNQLMIVDDVPNLFNYLVENNYNIDSSITNMLHKSDVRLNKKKIICFITYHGF